MKLNNLISECTAYDFKVMLEDKKPKSWLKSVSVFANGMGGSLFFGIDDEGTIYASTDAPNVGDHDGDMSDTKVANCQQKIKKYHQGVSDNKRPLYVGCIVGEEGK